MRSPNKPRMVTNLKALMVLMAATSALASERPNIVLILTDDFGHASLNSYGAPVSLVKTPAIDKLAATGVRFTDASTPSSVCTPTRYGLLMGEYPWRSRLKHGVVNVLDPLLLDTKRLNLPKWLQNLGYRTAAIGKWHLGYGDKQKQKAEDFLPPQRPGALEVGFDYHFAVPQNHGDITGVYIENELIYGLESSRVVPYSRSYYGQPYMGFDAPQRVNKDVMRVLTDKAIEWVKAAHNDKPFFLYFTPVAVHHPITPSDEMRGDSGSGPYGDFIQDIDASIGRLYATLNALNALENTIFIFTSDNGGDIPPQGNRPENYAVKQGLKINGNLRGDKHTIWEGGLRVPYIISWPGKIDAGLEINAMVNVLDTFATLAQLLGEPIPNPKLAAPDSFSFAPLLPGINAKSEAARTSMVTTNAQGLKALRRGKWKYLEGEYPETWPANRNKGKLGGQAVRSLFDLNSDPAESNNVINAFPEIADELQSELDAIEKAASERSR